MGNETPYEAMLHDPPQPFGEIPQHIAIDCYLLAWGFIFGQLIWILKSGCKPGKK